MKIVDKKSGFEVWMGNYKTYKYAVLNYWLYSVQNIDLDNQSQADKELLEKFFQVVYIVNTTSDIRSLFHALQFQNLNIFGDCTNLELKLR